MSRPKKSSAEKRNHQLPPIRCTEKEYRRVVALSEKAGVSLTSFIRHAAMNKKITPVDHDWSGVVIHLKRIGNNINQQTRKWHRFDRVPPELDQLWAKLSRVLDEIILNKHL